MVAFVRFVDAADALAKMLRLLVLCEKPKKIRERERERERESRIRRGSVREGPFKRPLSRGGAAEQTFSKVFYGLRASVMPGATLSIFIVAESKCFLISYA